MQDGSWDHRKTEDNSDCGSDGGGDGQRIAAVYATPAMIALMEHTASNSVAGELEEGQGTVGTLLHVKHVSATPGRHAGDLRGKAGGD